MATTLRSGISDTVNILNKLLLQTLAPDEETRLKKLRRIYFALWEEVIEQELDNQTPEFIEALEALSVAEQELDNARSDIGRINEAIHQTSLAAQAVDKVVRLGIGPFA